MTRLTTVEAHRRAARRRLPRMVFDFVDGGAEDEATVRSNVDAFRGLEFLPRRMVDVSVRSLETQVLGQPTSMPLMLSPTGLTALVNPAGESAVARAAAGAGAIYTVSTMSNTPLEAIREASNGRLWFLLYPWKVQGVVDELVARARSAGYETLVFGADVPAIGTRERDVRNGLSAPPQFRLHTAMNLLRHPRWVGAAARAGHFSGQLNFPNIGGISAARVDTVARFVNEQLVNPAATWELLREVRRAWDGPLVVKGITAPADARIAVDLGADGVMVSNHGGRQLDGEVSALRSLELTLDLIGDDAEVYLDGGIRRGSDVVKACAMGARACSMGRPYLYGLAHSGEDGVAQVLELLRQEIDLCLALLGSPSIKDLNPDFLVRAA